MYIGELSGAGNAGCTCDGPGGFCEVAHREWSEHASFPNDQSTGGALQHGKIMKHVSYLQHFPILTFKTSESRG